MTESSTYRSRRFQAGSSAFQIVTDGPETLQSFDALFAQFDEALPGDELVVITINTAGDQRYTASHRDSTICRSVGRHDLALWVTRFVNRHVLDHEPDLLHVHAGAVSNGDATALIVGQSFAGKSTLVAALVAAGWSYLSDEQIAIQQDGRMRPYPRPITLRAESWQFFDADLFPSNHGSDPDRVEIAPQALGQVYQGAPLRPTLVLCPDVSVADGDTTELSCADTLAGLLSNTLDLERAGQAGVDAMLAVVASAPGYQLAGQDLADTCRRVEMLAHRVQPPGSPVEANTVDQADDDPRLAGVRSWLFTDGSAAIYEPTAGALLRVDEAGYRAWQVLAAAPTNWPPEAADSPFVHELRDMGLLVDQTR